jgi:hypothetical protein
VPVLLRILVALAGVLLAAGESFALLDGVGGYSGPQLDIRTLQVGCAYSQNDTATLRSAIETGVCAGRTCFVPSGCRMLLGTPGAGDTVADWPSGTTIECEDTTAGFVLARKACSDSSDTPGAACTADNQCKGGTCDPDYPSGTAFAPDESSTYGVFGAAAGTTNITIKNCGIWVNQGSGDTPAMGGAGKRWGYCSAGGTAVTGEGCYNACNSSSGGFEGFACLANTDCNAGGAGTPGSCTARGGNCKSLGGSCTTIPYATNWGASGPGKINVFAWGSATGARIENVTVYDHRRGDVTFDVGSSGIIIDSTNRGDSLQQNQAAGQLFGATLYYPGATPSPTLTCTNDERCFAPSVVLGIDARQSTSVIRSVGSGWTTGIRARGGNYVTDSVGGGYGDPTLSGWLGNAALLVSGAGLRATGFVGGTGLYCVLPEFGLGYNFIVANAYCDGNYGPKFIVSNSGNQYLGVRGAWHGRGSVVGLGDQRGKCASGTRSGKVCIFGAGDDSLLGCPTGATCAADDAFPAGSANHFVIGGGSLLYSEEGNEVAYLRATDSKRCVNSAATDYGGPCTSDGDCSTGSCDYLTWTNALIDGVLDYAGTGSIGFDLSTSGVGWSTTQDAPSIANWSLSGVNVNGFATGFKFPSISRVCLGGSNDGTSCTADSTCTGSGRCRAQVENFDVSGTVSATTPLLNWSWAYGDATGLKGLLTSDDQGTIVSKTADGTIARGQLVKVATTADRVIVLGVGEGSQVYGLALNDATVGQNIKVLTSGQAQCVTDSGTIALGDLLKASTGTAGRVVTGSTAAGDVIVGVANANDPATGGLFDCTYRNPAVQAVIASPFTTVRKASDTGRTVSTPSADPELTFSTLANKKYAVDGLLIVSQTNATPDIQGGFDIPGSSLGTVNVSFVGGNAIGNPTLITGDNSPGKLAEIPNGTTSIFVSGTITTGASSGTTSFVWAQNGGPSATTTLLTGSFLRLMEIP